MDLRLFFVKNQDENKEKLLPEGTPLNTEAPIQPMRKKLRIPLVPVSTSHMITCTRSISFENEHQSWENYGRHDGAHSASIRSSRCGQIRSKSAQISSSGFDADEDSISQNHFDGASDIFCLFIEVIDFVFLVG